MSKKPLADPFTVPNVDEAAAQMYGGGDLAVSTSGKLKQLALVDIRPDPAQPRRVLPETVRLSQWTLPLELLTEWFDQAIDEARTELPVSAVLKELETEASEHIAGPVEAAFMGIVELAASIRRDGLTNPITAVRSGEGYIIETGERRWWAYWLLYAASGQWQLLPHDEKAKWEKIPARVMETFDPWRQASENSARANLNMVGKARQYALLLMDCWRDLGREFLTYDRCASDRAYYAQVLTLEAPRGANQKLMSACGVTNRESLSQYRQTLGLTDEQWIKADNESWGRREIERVSTAVDTSKKPTPPPRGAVARLTKVFAQNHEEYTKLRKKVGKMGQGDKSQISQMIEDEIMRLQELHHAFSE